MLKWERYSSVVMPPFPTSNMSDLKAEAAAHSGESMLADGNVYRPGGLTIPSTRPSV